MSLSSIDKLFTQFGTDLTGTRSLVAAMSKQLQGMNTSGFPKQNMMPKVFTSAQAKEYGMELPEGWKVSVLPVTDPQGNQHYHLTRPDGWTLTDVGQYISPTGQRMDEAQYMATAAGLRDTISQLSEAMAVSDSMPVPERIRAETMASEFLEALQVEGRTPETEMMLQSLFDATPEMVDQMFGTPDVAPVISTTQDTAIGKVLANPSSVPSEATQQDIAQYETNKHEGQKFIPFQGWVDADVESESLVDWDKPIAQSQLYWYSGVGDLYRGLASIANWKGLSGLAESISAFSSTPAFAQQPRVVESQGWRTALDPRYWTTELPRMMPFSVVSATVAMMATAGFGGPVTFVKTVLGSLVGGGVNTAWESAVQAGNIYEEVFARTGDAEKADEAANEVFKKNALMLGASEPLQNLIAMGGKFLPGASNPLLSFSVRTLTNIVTEGGQEGLQDVFDRQALGEDVKFDYQMQEAVMAGGLMGGGFSLALDTYSRLIDYSADNLPDGVRQEYEDNVEASVAAGMPEDQAKQEALDKACQTEAGREAVKQAAEDIKAEELQKEVDKPEPQFEVAPSEDLIADDFASNWYKRTFQQVKDLPGIKRMAEAVVGPRETTTLESQAVEDQVARGYILWMRVKQMGSNIGAVEKHVLQSIFSNPVKAFDFGKQGFSGTMQDVLLPEFESERESAGTIEHVFTHPEMYELSDKQLRYVTKVHSIFSRLLDMQKREGVEPKTLKTGWYIHRVVTGIMAVEEGDTNYIESKSRSRADQHRKYKTMADGIANGIVYSPNAEDSISEAIYLAYKKVADARFAKQIEEFGETPTEVLLREHPEIQKRMDKTKHDSLRLHKLHGAIELVRKGGKITEAQLRVFEREFPEIGKELRRLSPKGISDQKQLGEYVGYLKQRVRTLQSALDNEKKAREKAEHARKKAEVAKQSQHQENLAALEKAAAESKAELEQVRKESNQAIMNARSEAMNELTDDERLFQAFKLMDWEGRHAFRDALQQLGYEAEQAAYGGQAQAEALADVLASDPVYTQKFGKKQQPKKFTRKEMEAGKTERKRKFRSFQEVSLTSFLRGGQWPETITLAEAEALKSEVPPAHVRTPDGKRVYWHLWMDEVATELGFQDDQAFVNHIEELQSLEKQREDLLTINQETVGSYENIKHLIDLLDKADAGEKVMPQEPIEVMTKEEPTAQPAAATDAVPEVISEEEYLAQNGAGRNLIGDSALHKNIGTGSSRESLIKNASAKDAELVEKREALRTEYQARVEAGELRPPTRTEQLIEAANGHPDNESTQAARRLLDKQGIGWQVSEPGQVSEGTSKSPLALWRQTKAEATKEYRDRVEERIARNREYGYSFADEALERWKDNLAAAVARHEREVAGAILDGIIVSDEVLADYPKLAEKQRKLQAKHAKEYKASLGKWQYGKAPGFDGAARLQSQDGDLLAKVIAYEGKYRIIASDVQAHEWIDGSKYLNNPETGKREFDTIEAAIAGYEAAKQRSWFEFIGNTPADSREDILDFGEGACAVVNGQDIRTMTLDQFLAAMPSSQDLVESRTVDEITQQVMTVFGSDALSNEKFYDEMDETVELFVAEGCPDMAGDPLGPTLGSLRYAARERDTAETSDIWTSMLTKIWELYQVKAGTHLPGAERQVSEQVPETQPGEPEAGLQTDMFGYAKPYHPKGRGKITQISLDDYTKYTEAWTKAGNKGTPPNVGVSPAIEGVSEETAFWKSEEEPMPAPMNEKQRKAQLAELSAKVKQRHSGSYITFLQARKARSEAMENIKRGGLRLARVPQGREGALMQVSTNHRLFGGKLYHQTFVDEVNKWFGHEGDELGKVLKPVADTAGILRMAKATLDASWIGVQGQLAFGMAHNYLFTNPGLGMQMLGNWFKAWGYSLGAWIQPDIAAQYMAEHEEQILKRIQFGGSARSIDYFQALTAKGGVGGIGSRIMHGIPFDPFTRAEVSFLVGSEICRTSFWEILRPIAAKNGEEYELARLLDRMTGVMDTSTTGTPLTMRRLEQAAIWFAPSYTRACLSVVAHVFRGGFTGRHARRAVGGMVTAGIVYMGAANFVKALLDGKDEDEAFKEVLKMLGVQEDPLTHEVTWYPTSHFMSLQIGDNYYGIGGFWYGLVRLTGNILRAAEAVGDDGIVDYAAIIKDGGINRDNPFVNWWYSRSSPLVGTITDLKNHRTFLGYPIETKEEYAFYMLTRFTPIWMEAGLVPFLMPYVDEYLPNLSQQYEKPEGSAAYLSPILEFMGARTNPESRWSKYADGMNERLLQQPEEWFKQWYSAEELPSILEAVKEGTLTYRQLPKMAQQDLLGRYDDARELYEDAVEDSTIRDSAEWKAYTSRVKAERGYLNDRLADANERYRKGELTGYEWRQRVSEVYSQYGWTLDSMRNDPTYAVVFDYYDELRAKGETADFALDIALGEYQSIIYGDYDDPLSGETDWDERDRLMTAFGEKWGQDTVQKIEAYLKDKQVDKGTPGFNLAKSDAMDTVDEAYWDMETKERSEYRKANPDQDAALFMFGYGGRLQSVAAYKMVMDQALDQWGFTNDGITKMGLPPVHLSTDYFAYGNIIEEHGSASSEAKLYRLEHPSFQEWGEEASGWSVIDSDINVLRLDVKWAEQDDAYSETESEARGQYLIDNPEYAKARRLRDAYVNEIPEQYIDTYVDYWSVPGKESDTWYEEHSSEPFYGDDWWMMEHEDYYKDIYITLLGHKEKDFSKVPTKAVFNLYKSYKELPQGSPRTDYRAEHPELDEWLLLAGKVSKLVGEDYEVKVPEEEQTEWEKAEEARRLAEWIKNQ
ncbi:MAG: hypothetical protein JRE40_00910 [Deltaproteobacteria bacterium]|nr:hypothetical protein [Deltaproteobacteria bacterium]